MGPAQAARGQAGKMKAAPPEQDTETDRQSHGRRGPGRLGEPPDLGRAPLPEVERPPVSRPPSHSWPSRPRAGAAAWEPAQELCGREAGGLSESWEVPETQGAKGSFPALRKNPGKGPAEGPPPSPNRLQRGVTLPW